MVNKSQLSSAFNNFLMKLEADVIPSLKKDYTMGVERWNSWIRLTRQFFEVNLPAYLPAFNNRAKMSISRSLRRGESLSDRFLSMNIDPMRSFITSLMIDVSQDELTLYVDPSESKKLVESSMLRKAFIVHGHDESTKLKTSIFLGKLDFEAVILHEQASGGKTIIEKLEQFIDVGFGIVLYTPDDVGQSVNKQDNLLSRARQNVVFEHGLLLGKLGRGRVFPLVTDNSIELPGDISGMVYMSDKNWEIDLAKEIKALGYDVDLNKLF